MQCILQHLFMYCDRILSFVPEIDNKLLLHPNALCSLAFLSPLALRCLLSAPEPPASQAHHESDSASDSSGLGMQQALMKSLTSLPEKETVHNIPPSLPAIGANLPKLSLCIFDHVNAHSPVTLTINPLQKPSGVTAYYLGGITMSLFNASNIKDSFASTARRPQPHGPGPQHVDRPMILTCCIDYIDWDVRCDSLQTNGFGCEL